MGQHQSTTQVATMAESTPFKVVLAQFIIIFSSFIHQNRLKTLS
jgi:hypothetical protein